MRTKKEIKNLIINSTTDYLNNSGNDFQLTEIQNEYYDKISEFLIDDVSINKFKPLIITGVSGCGKTTPFKSLLSKYKNIGRYYDFQSFRNYEDYYNKVQSILNHKSNVGMIIHNDQTINLTVIDNFGLKSKVVNYSEHIDVISDVISHLHEITYNATDDHRGKIKHNKVVIITGLTFDEILNHIGGGEHATRRLFDLFPKSNRFEFTKDVVEEIFKTN